jgi:hypothetical protein
MDGCGYDLHDRVRVGMRVQTAEDGEWRKVKCAIQGCTGTVPGWLTEYRLCEQCYLEMDDAPRDERFGRRDAVKQRREKEEVSCQRNSKTNQNRR